MTRSQSRPRGRHGLPLGVQPIDDSGRLLCRYCHRWFRGLGHHIFPAHGVTPDAYRREFELPSTRPLIAPELSAALATRSQRRFQTDARLRQAFAISVDERAARNSRGRKAKQQTEHRAGVQRTKRAVGDLLAHNARVRANAVRADLDSRARNLGYCDLGQLFENTAHLSHASIGGLLGCSAAKARFWRSKHGIHSTARSTGANADAAHRQAILRSVPLGTQPIADDGRLQCLVCGRWWRDLRQHVQRTHRQPADAYAKQHRLTGAQAMVSRELQAKRAAGGRNAGVSNLRSAASAKSDRVKTAYDRRASAHGYSGIEALLAANVTRRRVAELIGCAPTSVDRIRRRYTTQASKSRQPSRPTPA
jgi:predicted transcriptional regulator